MNLFLVCLLPVLFAQDCLGLKCYVCHGATADGVGPCDEGQEIQIMECDGPGNPEDWYCQVRFQYNRRTHLGCSNDRDISLFLLVNNDPGPECIQESNRRETCHCGTDLCNKEIEKSFKCLQCVKGQGLDECGDKEIPMEEYCQREFCYYRWTNFSDDHPYRLYKGCTNYPQYSDNVYTKIENISMCYDAYDKGYYREQECYCKDSLCNNYLNVRKNMRKPEMPNGVGIIKFTSWTVIMIPLLSTATHFT